MHLALAPTPFPAELQYVHRIVNDAMDWIDGQTNNHPEQPLFLWLSFPEPHNPYQVPAKYWDLFPPQDLPPLRATEDHLRQQSHSWRWNLEQLRKAFPDFDQTRDRARSNYHGLLRMVDDQIRRFVLFLESKNIRDRSILMITSDHGDFVGEYGLIRKGPGISDLLSRIPLSVTGPGIPAGGTTANSAHISLVDLLPTCCGFSGAPIPLGTQGRNLTGLLRGEDDPASFRSMLIEQGFGGSAFDGSEDYDPTIDGLTPSPDGVTWGAFDGLNSVTQSGTRRAVRMGDWKLVAENDGSRALYHLPDDPCELHNRWNDPRCTVSQSALQDELITWLLATQDDLPVPAKRYRFKPGPTCRLHPPP